MQNYNHQRQKPRNSPSRLKMKYEKEKRMQKITRVLERVQIVEIVALFAELNTLCSSTELFHQEGVVLLDDLPYELPGNCGHLLLLNLHRVTTEQIQLSHKAIQQHPKTKLNRTQTRESNREKPVCFRLSGCEGKVNASVSTQALY